MLIIRVIIVCLALTKIVKFFFNYPRIILDSYYTRHSEPLKLLIFLLFIFKLSKLSTGGRHTTIRNFIIVMLLKYRLYALLYL